MECLWWNFALYLACYDRTCYLDENLHCNMYMDGTCLCMNNVYGWNLLMYEQCVWMKLMWYVIWNLCAGYVIWKYIYICHIYFLCKLWDLIRNRKNSQYAGSLPFATDGKEATWQPTVLPGSWPIWSVCLQWQAAKTLPSVADGKEPALCHQWQTAKNLPSSDV